MEYITVSRALDRLPLAYPKQITEEFRLKTQEVNIAFRGFIVTPVVDSNGLKLAYTGQKADIVNLCFNSSIVVNTQGCAFKLYIGFGGAPILRYFDDNGAYLQHKIPWQGQIYIGDQRIGFETFPFSSSYVELFTPTSNPKHFMTVNHHKVPILPPPPPLPMPDDHLPTYEETRLEPQSKRVKV